MKTIKIIVICLLFAGSTLTGGYAQNPNPDRMDRFNAQKIAFFTQQLHLTPKESQQFWPIYNEYQDKRNQILKEKREAISNFRKHVQDMSDKEIEESADNFVLYSKKEADLLVAYHQKFKEVLPIKKVMKLYQTENLYKTFLLRQIRSSQGSRYNQNAERKRRFNPEM